MKKLSLKDFKVSLSRDEMRVVTGGCCARLSSPFGGGSTCGLSKKDAYALATSYGSEYGSDSSGHWCCASC